MLDGEKRGSWDDPKNRHTVIRPPFIHTHVIGPQIIQGHQTLLLLPSSKLTYIDPASTINWSFSGSMTIYQRVLLKPMVFGSLGNSKTNKIMSYHHIRFFFTNKMALTMIKPNIGGSNLGYPWGGWASTRSPRKQISSLLILDEWKHDFGPQKIYWFSKVNSNPSLTLIEVHV